MLNIKHRAPNVPFTPSVKKPMTIEERKVTTILLVLGLGLGLSHDFLTWGNHHPQAPAYCEQGPAIAVTLKEKEEKAEKPVQKRARSAETTVEKLPMLRTIDEEILSEEDFLKREIFHQDLLATLPQDSQEFAEQLVAYGDTLTAAHKFSQADFFYRKALEHMEKNARTKCPTYRTALLSVSKVCVSLGRIEEAEQLRTRAANYNNT
ncbi:MAG: hypothetical protein JSS83_15155 [Cyanobacteria bacterium SZAS LIN-3]|nr:hypothetical protein [Cyanobacteria bacterium SZAS LIN-3]